MGAYACSRICDAIAENLRQPEFSRSFHVGEQEHGVVFDQAAIEVVEGRIYTVSAVADVSTVPLVAEELAS